MSRNRGAAGQSSRLGREGLRGKTGGLGEHGRVGRGGIPSLLLHRFHLGEVRAFLATYCPPAVGL